MVAYVNARSKGKDGVGKWSCLYEPFERTRIEDSVCWSDIRPELIGARYTIPAKACFWIEKWGNIPSRVSEFQLIIFQENSRKVELVCIDRPIE